MRFKAGDVIQFKNARSVTRQIKEVTSTGYLWTNPASDRLHDSTQSSDPFFEDGWKLVDASK
ncbi:hypothetical protein PHIM7_121 [Sinorhizobium phage phiM7]|uniref:Uncharacterized protein n=3 Tax=Emdodecavirus TaxID=1980937 RepID=S5MB11_9CAUD|nr:hypothetical protein AB690_gp374 [Sinorhizobium phage phiM12]YP_009212375.1 hypothetical protein AVT40_gp398 [Sinorhizobium phage phiN3]YP_009601246.1 hypothetical protein FDH46_gp357 [Sinorhizobium phage phiM7]AKF13027.1 hypothetical protein PHIM19_122 [Sinorhizobium phage phiM19]AGR47813.2 hypothetical protein SmphiM12_181 [Sinorhizobium phage phiM12]AKF12667.1 hypothetical protein PHIM7_121 [Sinorhizobium phage phiM7]AKF13398.1 hypothetical protein PHIN3_135 [Sinorhizobium phage phiN3]